MIQLSWDIHTSPPKEAGSLSLLGSWPWTFCYRSLNIHPPSPEIIHVCMLGILQLQGSTWLWLVWMLHLQPCYGLPVYIHLQILLFQTYSETKKGRREKKPQPIFSVKKFCVANFTTQNVTSISFNGIYSNTIYHEMQFDSRSTAQETIIKGHRAKYGGHTPQ